MITEIKDYKRFNKALEHWVQAKPYQVVKWWRSRKELKEALK